jgi:cytidyltransferase-like protein
MVVSLEEFSRLRDKELKDKKIVATSTFFDPPHPGHVSCIMESKKFGDILVVIIDGDTRAVNKKGKPFMPAVDRAQIADAIKGVDYVVIHEDPNAWNCVDAIKVVKPDVFTKGGDRNEKDRNDPNSGLKHEADLIESYGGRIEYNVGKAKVWSSSNYLKDWVDFINSREE